MMQVTFGTVVFFGCWVAVGASLLGWLADIAGLTVSPSLKCQEPSTAAGQARLSFITVAEYLRPKFAKPSFQNLANAELEILMQPLQMSFVSVPCHTAVHYSVMR